MARRRVGQLNLFRPYVARTATNPNLPAYIPRKKGEGFNHERSRARRLLWYHENKHRLPAYKQSERLKKRYGITPAQFTAMLRQQDELCEVCRRPETRMERGKVKTLSVDHDHKTGKVRGLLCAKCNPALGLLGEDPVRIEALARYIRKYNGA